MSALKSVGFVIRSSRLQLLKQYGVQIEVFRGLYAATNLGIDSFIHQQQRIKSQLTNIEEKFRIKMEENTQEGSKNVIFTEDLKNMIHIANSNDVDVVINMMKKFNQQNKELRFGNFVFGPVAMRMFYILNKVDEALACFKSPELAGFFDQLMSYQLLLDMLFENQRYDELLQCLTIIRDRQIEGTVYPRHVVVLTFAACYKQNTPESLQFAINLWQELAKVGHVPLRRATTFFASLLLNQDKPEIALEVLSSIRNQNYTTVRNLKLLTLMKLNRTEEIIPLLKSILNQEQIQTFNQDVLNITEEYISKQENNAEILAEFNHVMKIFKEQRHISDATLDQQLTSEIAGQNRTEPFQMRQQNNRFPRRREDFNQQGRPRRMALQEME